MTIPEELTSFVTYSRLIDMLDFETVNFNKKVSLTPTIKYGIESKWDQIRLENLLIQVEGNITKIQDSDIKPKGAFPVITQESTKLISGYADTLKPVTDIPLIVFGDHTCVYKYVDFEFVRGADGTQLIKVESELLLKYIFNLLPTILLPNKDKYERHFKYLKTLKIPLPPKNVQEKIVKECGKVDDKVEKARVEIKRCRDQMSNFIDDLYSKDYPKHKISQVAQINISKSEIKDLPDDLLVSFVEMSSVSEKGYITYREDRRLVDVKKASSYKYFRENDIILAKITPCMENGKCAIATNLTNHIGFGSSEFHVFRANQDKVYVEYLFALLNRDSVRKEAEKHMTGSSGHRRVPESFYANMQIPVPNNLKEQKTIIDQANKLIKKIQEAEFIMALSL